MTCSTHTCHKILKFVVVLPNFLLFQIIYQRRQVGKPYSLSYRQAPVKDLFRACASLEKQGICNHVRRHASRDRRVLVMEMEVGKAAYLAYSILNSKSINQTKYTLYHFKCP